MAGGEITGEAHADREVVVQYTYHPPLVNFRCERGDGAWFATASVATDHGPLELSVLVPAELVARWRSSSSTAATSGMTAEECAGECCGLALQAKLAKIVADASLARRLGMAYQAARVPMRALRMYHTARGLLDRARRTPAGREELRRVQARARTGDASCEQIARACAILAPHLEGRP